MMLKTPRSRPFLAVALLSGGLVLAGGTLHRPAPARAEGAPARYALPSEMSELVYVYESLRVAARRGDVEVFRELYDPVSLQRTFPDAADVRGERLTRTWLKAHAGEWPAVDDWDVAEGRVSGPWARVVYRHAHVAGGQPDGRWDYYFLVFHRPDKHWRLYRRAIATFGTPGVPEPPPAISELYVIPSFALPPQD